MDLGYNSLSVGCHRAYGARMTDVTCCPHCGRPGESVLDSLYREVARIRELAESRDGGQGTRPAAWAVAVNEAGDQSARSAAQIAQLTREVHELRATVARLRGAAVVGLAHSS
jgi:hypothetical protein